MAVILCDRFAAGPEGGLDAVRQALIGQRLQAYAASYLQELRAEANITFATN